MVFYFFTNIYNKLLNINMTSSNKAIARGLINSYPYFIEKSYKQELLNLVDRLEIIISSHFNNNKTQLIYDSYIKKNDGLIDDFQQSILIMQIAINKEVSKTTNIVEKYFLLTENFVNHNFQNSLNHFSLLNKSMLKSSFFEMSELVKINQIENNVSIENRGTLKKIWIKQNVSLIKNIPEKLLSSLENIIYEAFNSGDSLKNLKIKIQNALMITGNRARLIGRDQIAKLRSQIARKNDLNHGFTEYEWSSCKDGVVRSSHQILDGKICSWIDASIYKDSVNDEWKKRDIIGAISKHVGSDFQCRCTNIMIGKIQ